MSTSPPAGLVWTKASYCHASSSCVELAAAGPLIAVRNSRRPEVEIHYTREEIVAWLDGAKRGEFDHLVAE